MAIQLKTKVPNCEGKQIFVYGDSGVGKTSLLASAENPIILHAPRETGYKELANNGQVRDDIPHAEISSLQDLLDFCQAVEESDPVSTLGIDGFSELLELIEAEILRDVHKGDIKKYNNYGAGKGLMRRDHLKRLLYEFKRLQELGWTVILISHADLQSITDPQLASSYNRWHPDIEPKSWKLVKRQMTAVLFMKFISKVETNDTGQVRGVGGSSRAIYCNSADTHEAKNRSGMSSFFVLPSNPAEMWSKLMFEMKKNKPTAAPKPSTKPTPKPTPHTGAPKR